MQKNINAKDVLTRAIESNPCSLCAAQKRPQCKCAGAGGGGGSGGGSSGGSGGGSSGTNTSTTKSSTFDSASTKQFIAAPLPSNTLMLAPTTFADKNPLKMLSADEMLKLFSIDATRSGVLILRGESHLSPGQPLLLQAIFDAIKTEFKSFIKELARQNIATADFTVIQNDDRLTIDIPDAAARNAFFQQLVTKNILADGVAQMIQNAFERYAMRTPFKTSPF